MEILKSNINSNSSDLPEFNQKSENDLSAENEQLKAELETLKAEKREREIHKTASDMLSEKGVPAEFAEFVIGHCADNDELESKINAFAEIFSKETAKIKNEFAPTVTPLCGGRVKTLTREQFLNMPMSERQRLFETDRELYFELVK